MGTQNGTNGTGAAAPDVTTTQIKKRGRRPRVDVSAILSGTLQAGSFNATRVLGIRHQMKATTRGELRSTQVCVVDVATGKIVANYTLGSVNEEEDFAYGVYPISYRAVASGEDVSAFERPYQLRVQKLEKAELAAFDNRPDASALREQLRKPSKVIFIDGTNYVSTTDQKTGLRRVHVVIEIPDRYDGLVKGDLIAMSLGGSGDGLAAMFYAVGTPDVMVMRLPTAQLKAAREVGTSAKATKDADAELLVRLAMTNPSAFYEVTDLGRETLNVSVRQGEHAQAMASRIAHGNALIAGNRLSRYLGAKRGAPPNADVRQAHLDRVACDEVFTSLQAVEAVRLRELTNVVNRHPFYDRILKTVDGVGVGLAARIIASMSDPRRFAPTSYDPTVVDVPTMISVELREGLFDKLLPFMAAETDQGFVVFRDHHAASPIIWQRGTVTDLKAKGFNCREAARILAYWAERAWAKAATPSAKAWYEERVKEIMAASKPSLATDETSPEEESGENGEEGSVGGSPRKGKMTLVDARKQARGEVMQIVRRLRTAVDLMDQLAVVQMRAKIKNAQQAGGLLEVLPNVFDDLKQVNGCVDPKEELRFPWRQACVLARNWFRKQEGDEEAELQAGCLEEAIQLIDDRRKLKAARFNRGLWRFIANCGLNPDPIEEGLRRRKRGQVANYDPRGRQAGFLFGQQMVRSKGLWAEALLVLKANLRATHPEEKVGAVRRWYKGHVHKAAQWKLAFKLFAWFYRQVMSYLKDPQGFQCTPHAEFKLVAGATLDTAGDVGGAESTRFDDAEAGV